MAYNRPPVTTQAGQGLKQTPGTTVQSMGPVILDCEIASVTQLGVVKQGSNITIDLDGTINATGGGAVTTGSWTPNITPSVVGNIILNTRTATWTKIDNLVTAIFDIEITNIIAGDKDAKLKLTKLPFTSISSTGYVGTLHIGYFTNMNSNVDYISGTVINNSKEVDLWFNTEQKKTLINLTQNDVKVTTRLVGTITYISAT